MQICPLRIPPTIGQSTSWEIYRIHFSTDQTHLPPTTPIALKLPQTQKASKVRQFRRICRMFQNNSYLAQVAKQLTYSTSPWPGRHVIQMKVIQLEIFQSIMSFFLFLIFSCPKVDRNFLRWIFESEKKYLMFYAI